MKPLNPQEQIGLRRIAHGSPIRDEHLIERLRALGLVHRMSGTLRLTPLGLKRYDTMAKAPLLAKRRSLRATADYIEGVLEKARARLEADEATTAIRSGSGNALTVLDFKSHDGPVLQVAPRATRPALAGIDSGATVDLAAAGAAQPIGAVRHCADGVTALPGKSPQAEPD